jgi:hypothetical protein
MRKMIKHTIEILKERVKVNLLEIRNNKDEIRRLHDQPNSSESSAELEVKYSQSRMLLSENADFINVQLTLTNFIEKYHDNDIFDTKKLEQLNMVNTNENVCFEQTINGEVAFDANHPYYDDDNFFRKLLYYYQDREDFEKCSVLVEGKKSRIKG